MNPNFDGKTAPGSMFGVRAFNTDVLGRLTGITVKSVFRPGENVARCRTDAVTRQRRGGDIPAVHRAGTGGCSCGYWAYTDGTHAYSEPHLWTAIIEGYGLVTVGTRGFRAEKARLVALVPPATETPRDARTAHLYGREGIPIYPTLTAALNRHPITGYAIDDEPDDGFWTRDAETNNNDAVVVATWAGFGGIITPAAAAAAAAAAGAAIRPIPTGCSCPLCR